MFSEEMLNAPHQMAKDKQLSDEQINAYKEAFVFATSFTTPQVERHSKLSRARQTKNNRKTKSSRPSKKSSVRSGSTLRSGVAGRRTAGNSSIGRRADEGKFGEDELKNMLSVFGYDDVTKNELQSLLRLHKTTGSNGMASANSRAGLELEFGEYLNMMVSKKEAENNMTDDPYESELKKLFNMFDNGSGHISVDDLMELMDSIDESITEQECVEMMKYVGRDADEGISFKDFMKLLEVEEREYHG